MVFNEYPWQTDFWRMVLQERTGLIVMLCAAVETATLGPLDRRPLNYCPYYWPKWGGNDTNELHGYEKQKNKLNVDYEFGLMQLHFYWVGHIK